MTRLCFQNLHLPEELAECRAEADQLRASEAMRLAEMSQIAKATGGLGCRFVRVYTHSEGSIVCLLLGKLYKHLMKEVQCKTDDIEEFGLD